MKIQLLLHAEIYQSNNPEQIQSKKVHVASFDAEDIKTIISEHHALDGVKKNFAKFSLRNNHIAPGDEASDNGFYGERIAMFEDGSIDLYAANGEVTASMTMAKGAVILANALNSANAMGVSSDLEIMFVGDSLEHSKAISNKLTSGSVDLFTNLKPENILWRDASNNLVAAPEKLSSLVIDSSGAFHRSVDGKLQTRNRDYHSESSLISP